MSTNKNTGLGWILIFFQNSVFLLSLRIYCFIDSCLTWHQLIKVIVTWGLFSSREHLNNNNNNKQASSGVFPGEILPLSQVVGFTFRFCTRILRARCTPAALPSRASGHGHPTCSSRSWAGAQVLRAIRLKSQLCGHAPAFPGSESRCSLPDQSPRERQLIGGARDRLSGLKPWANTVWDCWVSVTSVLSLRSRGLKSLHPKSPALRVGK